MDGLRTGWTNASRREATHLTLLPIVSHLCRRARTDDKAARARLDTAEKASPLPEAAAIRRRRRFPRPDLDVGGVKVADFYDGIMKLPKHPADDLASLLRRVDTQWSRLTRAKWLIDRLQTKSDGVRAVWANTKEVALQAADESSVAQTEELQRDVWRKLNDRLADSPPIAYALKLERDLETRMSRDSDLTEIASGAPSAPV